MSVNRNQISLMLVREDWLLLRNAAATRRMPITRLVMKMLEEGFEALKKGEPLPFDSAPVEEVEQQ